MSMDMVFVNGFVIIIFLFLIYCVIFRFRDARFSFLNLLRHRRRSLSTTCAIILGGVAIFYMAVSLVILSGFSSSK